MSGWKIFGSKLNPVLCLDPSTQAVMSERLEPLVRLVPAKALKGLHEQLVALQAEMVKRVGIEVQFYRLNRSLRRRLEAAHIRRWDDRLELSISRHLTEALVGFPIKCGA